MKFARQLSVFFIASSIFLTGCGSKIVSTPVKDFTAENRGIIYFLPKTMFTVKCNLALYRDALGGIECRLKPKIEAQNVGIEIKPTIVADENFPFCIDTEKLSSPFVATGGLTSDQAEKGTAHSAADKVEDMKPLTIEIKPNGTINLIRARFMDRSAAVLENIEQGATKLAEGALRIAAFGDEGKDLLSPIKEFELKRTIEPHPGRIEFTNPWIRRQIDQIAASNGVQNVRIPAIELAFDMPSPPQNKTQVLELSEKVKGLVVRNSVAIPVSVFVDNGNGFELTDVSNQLIAQAGEISVLSMESAMFATRSHSVSFGDDGAMKTLDVRSTSSIRGLTEQLKISSERVLGVFREVLPGIQVKAKKEVAESKTNALTAEKQLLDAKKKLAEVQRKKSIQ